MHDAQRLCFCSGALRSRVLSHETKRGTKIKTYNLHLTAPLQKHFVGRSCRSPAPPSQSQLLIFD
jgi:hypothetical protein